MTDHGDTADALAKAYAELRDATNAIPVGDAPVDARVEWWEQHARSEEAAAQVWRRLHERLLTTWAHPVLTLATADAAELRQGKALQCWEQAALAREQQEWR